MSLRWNIAQYAELKWWQNYLKAKPKDDYLVWKKKYWTKFLSDIELLPKPASKILDAGCGPAGIFTVLDAHEVTAIDPLLSKYEAELPHFDPKDWPFASFETATLESYSSPNTFDYTLCINAINHVDDMALAFRKLGENVKPGGTLVVSIDAHNHGFLKKIFQLLPGDILHPHQYNKEEYQAYMEQAGIKDIKAYRLDKAFIFDYWVLVGIKA